MKHLLALIILLCLSLTATAQNEQDFASTYMKLYASGTTLTCQTISPAMITKMLQQQTEGENSDTKQALKNIRSMRIVSNKKATETAALHEKAATLLKNNKGRYKLYQDYDGKSLFTRKRGNTIVELILVAENNGCLHIVNITGTMDETFVKRLINQ